MSTSIKDIVRIEALERSVESLARRLDQIEQESQRRKPGRPRKDNGKDQDREDRYRHAER